MERRTVLAIVLMALILGAYQFYLSKTTPPSPPVAPREEKREVAPVEEAAEPAKTSDDSFSAALATPSVQEQEIVVETDLVRVTLSTRGGKVTGWQLKRYLGSEGIPLDLIPGENGKDPSSFLRTWSRIREADVRVYAADVKGLSLSQAQPKGMVSLRCVTSSGLELTKSFTFYNDDYRVDLETRARNLTRREQSLTFDLFWGPGLRQGGEEGLKGLKPPTSLVDGRRIQDKWEKLEGPEAHKGAVSWTAVHDNYFCAALIPLGKGATARVEKVNNEGPMVSLSFSPRRLLPREAASESFSLFVGPKEIDRLTRLGFGLREIIDLGWFGILARPALFFLKYINQYLKNYGLAIIVLTLLVRIILFPLTYKSFRSMQEMQRLQPKMNALRERFKDDSKRMNQELMDLYRKHNINPMGGCLPMLLQIPIFIALYNALINSVELWKAPFALWIKDLSAKDPYYVFPILMGASWVIQQWMTPTTGDPRQAKMMLFMPVVFTFMFLNFPAGLVLYFFVSNLLGIAQQYYMNRQLRVPAKAGGRE